MKRRTLLVAMTVAVGLIGAAPASAHESPNGCRVNGIDLVLFESSTLVRPGDTMTFKVGVQNNNALFGTPCDITGANIGFRLPTASGRYDPATPALNLALNQPFPSMVGPRQMGPDLTWVVNLTNPRETFGAAQATVRGTLHVTNPDQDTGDIVKDISFTITNPSISIDKTGSITNGQAPQNVTYTYVVTNTSQTVVPMNQVRVRDDLCANPTYASGDNGDSVLSNGERWTFTCTTLHQAPGTYTNTATACAISAVDARDVCSPPDTWTVTLNGPPPAPQGAVKPVAVVQPPCTLSRANKTTVRARQLNTIRVRVRNVDVGSKVTLTLPHTKKKKTAKVDMNGIATFRVRPTRSGTARIQAPECSDVERLSVKPARRTVARRAPRVTG
jgi:uncharacterized repeat protein (TIGR01451 family)